VGKKTGKNPTDRGKLGVKRSTLVDGRGVPLAVAIEGANVPDPKLVCETLDAIPIERPEPTSGQPQNLCLDKGYVGEPVDCQVRERGYTPHVPRKANQAPKPKRRRNPARRWKVERTHSWLNRARRILIRWEKKATNYLGFLHLQLVATRLAPALTHWKARGCRQGASME
jgi:putative transposase